MTGCRDMDKKHQKYPKNGGFPPFVTPRFFFKNRALSLLHPYSAQTSCMILEKTNGRSLSYLKTDRRTNGRPQAVVHRTPSDKLGSKMKNLDFLAFYQNLNKFKRINKAEI